MQKARAFGGRTIRAVKLVLRNGRIPGPLRWGAALGLLPVPGPFDEAVLLAVGGILCLFYRNRLTDAWKRAAPVSSSFTCSECGRQSDEKATGWEAHLGADDMDEVPG
jgi:hypothetical protein